MSSTSSSYRTVRKGARGFAVRMINRTFGYLAVVPFVLFVGIFGSLFLFIMTAKQIHRDNSGHYWFWELM